MRCINNTSERLNGNVFTPVKKFIEEKFSKDRSLRNTVIVVGYNQGIKFREVKRKNKGKKIIVYQLEQLYNYSSLWYNPKSEEPVVQKRTVHIQEWLDGVDEIWDYDLDNVEFLKSLGFKNIKHVPLEICNSVRYENKIDKPEYDIVFYGALNERRMEYLRYLDDKYKLLVVCHQGNKKMKGYEFKNTVRHCFGQELFNHIFNAKMVINLHYYEVCLQEQVRLFELLSNDVKVISEKSKINYLNVEEFSDIEEMDLKISKLLEKKKILSVYHVFNEMNWLHLQKKWCDYNNCEMYVVDHMSTDGTWEWLKENNIPSHRFDNGGSFHQHELQNELLKAIRILNPDWVLYGDADTFLQVDEKLDVFIDRIDRNGYDAVETTTVQMYNTGEELNKHAINTYYYGALAPRKQIRLAKYHSNFAFDSDVIKNSKNVFKYGYFINYGGTKSIEERLLSLERTKTAWKNGMNPGYGTHLEKAVNKNCIWDKNDLENLKNSKIFYNLFNFITPLTKNSTTSMVEIKDNKVKKIVDYNKYTKELLDREEYWLKKLEPFNIAPKFIERDENSITMSYCGNTATENDFKTPYVQHQLLNILRVLLENKCFYNDFKVDNFTILNNKLYIIDFGWCPEIKEDFTCGGFTESQLKTKPHKNIYSLFDINLKTEQPVISNNSLYLTKEKYFEITEKEKELNPAHWITNKNQDTYLTRWEYHNKTVEILKSLKLTNILEAGTMGVKCYENSDTIDFNLPNKGWKLTYEPTYNYDLTKVPWSIIKNKQYDVFIALRVFHHFLETKKYLNEMLRISKHVILALPRKKAREYIRIKKPNKKYICKESNTIILHYY